MTTDASLMGQIMQQFDQVWMGARCVACQRKKPCATFLEIMSSLGSGQRMNLLYSSQESSC